MSGKAGGRWRSAPGRIAVGLVLALVAALPASAFPLNPAMSPAFATGASPGLTTVAEAWTGRAACLSQDASLGARLAPHLEGPGLDARVAGFDLRDEPAPVVAAFRALTRKLDKAIARGKAAPPPSDCHDAVCAMTALVGPELGPRMLLLAVEHGFMASDLGAGADRRWTARELDVVLAALSDLPTGAFAPDKARYRLLLHRHTEAAMRIGALAPSAGFLVALAGEGYPGVLIADGWDRIGPRERRVVMAHELAHELARKAPSGWWRDWRRAVKADRAAARAVGTPGSVSIYAETEAGEDFAESVAAYRYMPGLLTTRATARYAFLKARVFGGIEYGSEASCAPDGAAFSVAAR